MTLGFHVISITAPAMGGMNSAMDVAQGSNMQFHRPFQSCSIHHPFMINLFNCLHVSVTLMSLKVHVSSAISNIVKLLNSSVQPLRK